LKAEGKCPHELGLRQVKYLNNVVEADQGKLKQLIIWLMVVEFCGNPEG